MGTSENSESSRELDREDRPKCLEYGLLQEGEESMDVLREGEESYLELALALSISHEEERTGVIVSTKEYQ